MPGFPGLGWKISEVLNFESVAPGEGGDLSQRLVSVRQSLQAMAKGSQVKNAPEPYGVRDVAGGFWRVRSVQCLNLPERKRQPTKYDESIKDVTW